jgi:hypothetical protein
VLFEELAMLACFHPVTGPVLLALTIGLSAMVAILGVASLRHNTLSTPPDNLARRAILLLAGFAALVALTLWLTSYALSPLPFARRPVLRGFSIQKQGRPATEVASRQGFTIPQGSTAAITPLLEPHKVTCSWTSRAKAMLDAANECDIAYLAPPRESDRLRVAIRSECGLGVSTGYLDVQILPP